MYEELHKHDCLLNDDSEALACVKCSYGYLACLNAFQVVDSFFSSMLKQPKCFAAVTDRCNCRGKKLTFVPTDTTPSTNESTQTGKSQVGKGRWAADVSTAVWQCFSHSD